MDPRDLTKQEMEDWAVQHTEEVCEAYIRHLLDIRADVEMDVDMACELVDSLVSNSPYRERLFYDWVREKYGKRILRWYAEIIGGE